MLNWLPDPLAPHVVALALSLLACAVLTWPDSRAARRILFAPDFNTRLDRSTWTRFLPLTAAPFAVTVGGLIAGVGGACAAIMLGLLTRKHWRSRQRLSRRVRGSTELAAGIRLLVSELRAGAHPATAAEGVAAEAEPSVRRVFADIAATARLGGDVAAGLQRAQGLTPDLREVAHRLARCWSLAEVHGIATADLLDSVRRDLEYRAAFTREVESKMAGPRATAAVLTGLPVLGILLGEAVGAEPIAVLTGGLFGQLLLVVGAALLCAGVHWTCKLTESAVLP